MWNKLSQLILITLDRSFRMVSNVLKTVSSHNYHLRSTTRGDIISKAKVPNTKNALNSFSNKGKELWNCLPIEIRHSKSLYNFKTLLKKYLFQKQISSCDTALVSKWLFHQFWILICIIPFSRWTYDLI